MSAREVISFLLCLALSFLFSGMEAGVFALNRLRIRRQMRAGDVSARLLHGYLQAPEDFLWTILVGNTLAMFGACGLAVAAVHQAAGGHWPIFAAAFAGSVWLYYTFCDLLPKMLFRQIPTRLCLWLAKPFRIIHWALSPVVSLVRWFSDRLLKWTGQSSFKGQFFTDRSELRLAMEAGSSSFTSEERRMVNRVLDLQNVPLRSIATPLDERMAVAEEAPVKRFLEICKEHGIFRIPVWRDAGSGRRVIGVISLRAILYAAEIDPQTPAKAFLKPALYLREDLRLEEAIARMQRSGQRLAVVLGADQREIGLVTLQQILGAVFGEVVL